MYFADFSLTRIEQKPRQENVMGTCRLTFSLYTRCGCSRCSYCRVLRSLSCLMAIQNRVQIAYASSGSQC